MLEPQHHAGNMDVEDGCAMRGCVSGGVHELPSEWRLSLPALLPQVRSSDAITCLASVDFRHDTDSTTCSLPCLNTSLCNLHRRRVYALSGDVALAHLQW